jgi:hypothetical protein
MWKFKLAGLLITATMFIVLGAYGYKRYSDRVKPVTIKPLVSSNTTTSSTVTVKPVNGKCPEVTVNSSSTALSTVDASKGIVASSSRRYRLGIGISDLMKLGSGVSVLKSIESYYIEGSVKINDGIDVNVRLNGKKEISVGVGVSF